MWIKGNSFKPNQFLCLIHPKYDKTQINQNIAAKVFFLLALLELKGFFLKQKSPNSENYPEFEAWQNTGITAVRLSW